jgi:hypothetical protein
VFSSNNGGKPGRSIYFKVNDMTDRKTLSKKTRFEIFKRDSFTCQYCGKSAPDVILQVDHIMPVSKGGENEITNLITACYLCNQGKRDILLDDDAVIAKRKKQLDELQERREQIEMMYEWQSGLADLDSEQVGVVCKLFSELISGYSINENGQEYLKKVITKYGLSEVLESLRISTNQYLELRDGKTTPESVTKAYEYIEKICRNRKRIKEKPYLADLYKASNIVRYKSRYYNHWQVMNILEKAYRSGADADDLIFIAQQANSYSHWENSMLKFIEHLEVTYGE